VSAESVRAGRVVVLGAGPCGLACARELVRLGHDDWIVLEAGAEAGGHASSAVDPQGFTWDIGGHVVFSHYGEFDALLDEVLGADVYEHERSSFVRHSGRWVPYPFQNNLHRLELDVAVDCLVDLARAPGADGASDFETWIRGTFGDAIAETFMLPYNAKVWTVPARELAAGWIADRVSVVDARRALRNLLAGVDDAGWGPNATFRFPRRGGTGEIYRRLATRLGDRVLYGRSAVRVDPGRRVVTTADGAEEPYDALVSTVPLDLLVGIIDGCPGAVRAATGALRHNGIQMVGVGLERPLADDRSWLYFPGPETPFYRVTNFAKYSPAHVPGADTARYCAYMTESAYPSGSPREVGRLEQDVLAGLVAGGVVDAAGPVASLHTIDAPYAYPLPTLDRDRALAAIQPWLMERSIYSRGRFGAWKYEIGNMDHAVKMGIDAARLVAEGRPEEAWTL
jgi:protoporphyrinogen oxidase